MTRFCLIFIFLFKAFSGSAAVPGQLAYADSLFKAANFKQAALEYEHVVFLNGDSKEKATALLQKSYCLKNIGEYEKAYRTLQRINLSNLPDSIQFKIRYENLLDAYLSGNEQEAETAIADIDYNTKDPELLAKCLYLKIIVRNDFFKWIEADSLMKIYLNINHINADSAHIEALLKKPHLINERTAKILSYIIPGSGQMYSGHVFRGLTSIVFQGAFLGYTIMSIKNGFYISGFAVGFGVFQMFYLGGAKYAFYLAEKKNEKKINLYNKKIKEFLLNTERRKI